MIKKIIKRDGSQEKFKKEKIIIAISKACLSVGVFPNDECKHIAEKIMKEGPEEITISELQKIVEKELMKADFEKANDVATSYIIYRNEKDKERRLIKTYTEIVEIEDGDIKNENANINGNTPAGQMMKFASVSSSDFADTHIIPKTYSEAQKRGEIHIHDKDYYATRTTTCHHTDLGSLLRNGFSTEHGTIREPNRIKAAIDLAAISLQTSQNEQHGGQSIPAWDNFLAPYLAKTFKEHVAESIFTYLSIDGKVQGDYSKSHYENIIRTTEEDFGEVRLDNERLERDLPNIYKLAKQKTIRDCDQAHEGFVANMNTMHSRGK